MMCVVGVVFVVMSVAALPVVIDHKHREQDDGNNLQNQGQNGELEPHVGGVRRHPESGCISTLHTHSGFPPCLSVVCV